MKIMIWELIFSQLEPRAQKYLKTCQQHCTRHQGMDLKSPSVGLTDINNNNSSETSKEPYLTNFQSTKVENNKKKNLHEVRKVSKSLNKKDSIESDLNDDEYDGENHKCIFRPFTRESIRKIKKRIDQEKLNEQNRFATNF